MKCENQENTVESGTRSGRDIGNTDKGPEEGTKLKEATKDKGKAP